MLYIEMIPFMVFDDCDFKHNNSPYYLLHDFIALIIK